jgi:hypothetical protein
MNKILFYLAAVLFPVVLFAQKETVDCSKIQKGSFYYYPSNTNKKFVITRTASIQKEIDMDSGDSSFYSINWRGDCLFNAKFISRSKPLSNEDLTFRKSHMIVSEVTAITDNYYVFRAGLDSISIGDPLIDTVWFKPR